MGQFHWDPATYLELMRREVPGYEALQEALVDASSDVEVRTILELGIGSGEVRLEDPLPSGPHDLVASALAVHHLDGPAKRDLFRRVAAVLRPGGRFVLADVVVPRDPADARTPIDPSHDEPSPVGDQLRWLAAAGLAARVTWARRDPAVVTADRGPRA